MFVQTTLKLADQHFLRELTHGKVNLVFNGIHISNVQPARWMSIFVNEEKLLDTFDFLCPARVTKVIVHAPEWKGVKV